ncbi:hypothetical protein Rt10032_c22g6579 [Rhodotorula toruloides]|uniref:Proteophosphoglycan ppg4 n=1 Tax=Rhodotorula toruloides TaxID=5286 RepID=A0A511KQB0_RHOTO|nr:hypothetical protein Rt10032_c22g6579 [Rhodotorula toruloides]
MVEGWADCRERKRLDTVEELWLIYPCCAARETIPLTAPNAKRLHIYITKRPPEAPLIQITAGLAYKQLGSPDVTLLHFVGGILNLYPSPNRFRNLETLILRGVHHLGPRPAFMREWGQATIRNLCLMHDHVIEPRDIQNLSSTLEYLAYGPPRECENDFARLDNGVAFPASLRTITLMLPSDDRDVVPPVRLSASSPSLAQTRTAQIPLAMAVLLPVELQQYILELAIPPLIQSLLDERTRLCKTFSLVHRTWTPIAQRKLRAVCSITLKTGCNHKQAAQLSLRAATKAGWTAGDSRSGTQKRSTLRCPSPQLSTWTSFYEGVQHSRARASEAAKAGLEFGARSHQN